MIPLPAGTKIWIVAGITDMRNGFNGLAAKVQTTLNVAPLRGEHGSTAASTVFKIQPHLNARAV